MENTKQQNGEMGARVPLYNETENSTTTNTELIERVPLGTSALDMVGNPEKGYAVVMGKKRITAWFKTMQELKNYIKHDKWHFIIQLFGTIYEYIEEAKTRNILEKHEEAVNGLSTNVDNSSL